MATLGENAQRLLPPEDGQNGAEEDPTEGAPAAVAPSAGPGEEDGVNATRAGRQEGWPLFVAEPKIDGLTCALLYENGRLVRAATRGDGTRGEDVTQNALALGETVVPHLLRHPGAETPAEASPLPSAAVVAVAAAEVKIPARFEVRGEIYMSDEAFERLNVEREGEGFPAFVSARNAAAGSLRQLDADVSRGRGLRFFAYGAAVGDGSGDGDGSGELEARAESLADVFGTQVSATMII